MSFKSEPGFSLQKDMQIKREHGVSPQRKQIPFNCDPAVSPQKKHIAFKCEPGFCPQCGSILPPLGIIGGVACYTCKQNYGPEVFGDMEEHYTIHFNSLKSYTSITSATKGVGEQDADGPVVERRCPKCNNDKMSYATLQLRSADEGQTIFYTCTKCRFKETENS